MSSLRSRSSIPPACPRRGGRVLARLLPVLMSLPLAAFASEPPDAAPQAWKLDPVHTRVMFSVSHAGFSNALGTVSGSDGGMLFDPDDWSGARLVVEVPLDRLDLGDAAWNDAARAANLLDTSRWPIARFVSNNVDPQDARRARVCGDLTLHGVTRPLCMDVTVNAVERHPMPPFRQTAGFSATATLSRAEFGIDAWSSVIGDEVELRIEAEATRASDAFAQRVLAAPATGSSEPKP